MKQYGVIDKSFDDGYFRMSYETSIKDVYAIAKVGLNRYRLSNAL